MALAQPCQAQDTAFGTLDESQTGEAALIGTFYDLKQSPTRESTGINSDNYLATVRDFVKSGWNEARLSKYYRAGKAMQSTAVWIPMIDAGEAPKAFDVDKTVRPNCWIVHYKAEIIPPADGVYRFVGGCDDIIAVAVDGELVMAGGRPETLDLWKGLNWAKDPEAGKMFNEVMFFYGNWVEFKKDTPRSIDILIGERPGATFGAGLIVQKQGETYQNSAAGNPILPVFQVAPGKLPERDSEYTPKHLTDGPIWKALQ